MQIEVYKIIRNRDGFDSNKAIVNYEVYDV